MDNPFDAIYGGTATAVKPAVSSNPFDSIYGGTPAKATPSTPPAPVKTKEWNGQQIPSTIPTRNLVSYDAATGYKTFNLGNASKGVYTEDANGKLVKEGHTTYGGVAPVKGQQRDDVIPAGLGGANSNAGNISLVPNDTAHAQDKIETQLSKDVKSGKIQPKAAINTALAQKADIASKQNPVSSFFSAISNTFAPSNIKQTFGIKSESAPMTFKVGEGLDTKGKQNAKAQIIREQQLGSEPVPQTPTNMDLGGGLKQVARALPRAVAEVTQSVVPTNKQREIEPVTQTPFFRFLMGDETLKPLAQQTVETENMLKDKGFGKASTPLAILGVSTNTAIALSPLIAPLAEIANEAIAQLAKEASTKELIITFSDAQKITSGVGIEKVSPEKIAAFKATASEHPDLLKAFKDGGLKVTQTQETPLSTVLKKASGAPLQEGASYSLPEQPKVSVTAPFAHELNTPKVPETPAFAHEAQTAPFAQEIAQKPAVEPKTAPETAITPKEEIAPVKTELPKEVSNLPALDQKDYTNYIAPKESSLPAPKATETRIYYGGDGSPSQYVDTQLPVALNRGVNEKTNVLNIDSSRLSSTGDPARDARGERLLDVKPVNAQAGFVAPGQAISDIAEGVKNKIDSAKKLIAETNKGLKASSNLEDSLFKIKMAAKADKLQASEFIKNSKLTNKDAEAIYHYEENKSLPLTDTQRQAYNNEIKPLADESAKLVAKLKPLIPLNEETYTPRFVENKGGVIDRMVQKGKAMGGNVLNKSAQSLKKRTMKALVDDKGNRTVVSIKNGRVIGFTNKKAVDLGAIKLKTNEQLFEQDIKPLQKSLEVLQRKLDGIKQIKVKDPVSIERINKVLSELYDISTQARHLAEETTPQITKNIQSKINNALDVTQNLKEGLEGYSKFAYSDKGVALLKKQLGVVESKLEQLKIKKIDNSNAKTVQTEKTRLQNKAKLLTERLKTLDSIKTAHELTNIQSRVQAVQKKMVELSNAMADIENKYNPNELNNKKFVAKGGEQYKITDATTKEIEANTNLTYHKNSLVNQTITYLKLKQVDRAVTFLEQYKESPEFKSVAVKFGEGNAPDGWRPTALQTFRGYVFEPHVAAVLDDFNKAMVNGSDPLKILTAANSFLRTSIFFNPLIHVPNIANHWFVARGVTPFLRPKGWVDLVKTSTKAINAVMRQNSDYTDMLKSGANLMYADENVRNLNDLLLQKMSNNIETDPQLKFFGETVPNFVKWLNPYKISGKITWAVNDIATMQAVYEDMANGMSMEQAINQVGKHIPNYRIPANVLGSEAVSKFLKNPNITMFSAYHYGALKSYLETAKDFVKGTTAERAKAFDRLAMLGLITLVLYPQLDKLAKKITGNKNAMFRRAGASTFAYATGQLAQGKQDIGQFITTFLTPAPATKETIQQIFNTDLFTGQKIRTPGTPGTQQLKDSATHAGLQVSPLQQYQKVKSGSVSGQDYVASLFGISSPKSTPTVKILQNMVYDEKIKIQSQLKELVANGKMDEANKVMNEYNNRLKDKVKQAFREGGQDIPNNLDDIVKKQQIKLPGAKAMENYKSNKDKPSLQKILK